MSATISDLAFKRERILVFFAITTLTSLAWWYMFHLDGKMRGMELGMHDPPSRSLAGFFLTFAMWAVMMVAMMLPSALQMIDTFAGLLKRRDNKDASHASLLFVTAYIVCWSFYSAVATSLQWWLQDSSLVSPMLVSAHPVLSATLLIAAGLYQLTPLKHACLSTCRSPMAFLVANWRNGKSGAIYMGMKHGTYCIGCCWSLMLLLFVGGVMSLVWIALLAAYVLVEKTMRDSGWFSKVAGVGAILWGISILAGNAV